MPSTCWSPPVERREVITSSKTSSTSCSARRVAQRSRNSRSPGMTPPEPCSGSTTHGRELVRVLGDQPRRALGVVVLRDDERERRVDRRARRRREEEDAAVVAALEDHDRGLPVATRASDMREQVRLGARVAEPHELDGREALAHRRGEALLVAVRRAERDPVVERVANRLRRRPDGSGRRARPCTRRGSRRTRARRRRSAAHPRRARS